MVFVSGTHPTLESLFSLSGFVQSNPLISYTLAGSFCRFLIDSFGIDRFKFIYGGGNFKNIYHRDGESLFAAWQSSVMHIPLQNADNVKAAYFFRRPSIFGKECARVIANLNAETRELLDHREYEKALASAEHSLGLSKTPEAVFQKATALFEIRRFHDFIEFVQGQLSDTSVGFALIPLHLRLGDAYWALDSIAKARREYETMSRLWLNNANEEACLLRIEALKNPQERGELRVYFTFALEDTVRIARLEHLTDPVARYMLAREYAAKDRFTESGRMFNQSERWSHRRSNFSASYEQGGTGLRCRILIKQRKRSRNRSKSSTVVLQWKPQNGWSDVSLPGNLAKVKNRA